MKYSPKQYAQALFEAVNEVQGRDVDVVLHNFTKALIDHGRSSDIHEIEMEFKGLMLAKEGIKQAELTVAKDAEINKEILTELNRVAGSKLKINTKVDESIIGGVVLKVEDLMLDASIKNQISNLKEHLINQ